MKLRHVLLLACAMGACGALLLAWDMRKRLKYAESVLLLKGLQNAPQPRAEGAAGAPQGGSFALADDQSTIIAFTTHALGLLSLAFLFLAILLLLISALRERAFAFAIDGEPAAPPTESPAVLPVVRSLAEAAQQEQPAPVLQETGKDSAPPLQAGASESAAPQPEEGK